jgi:HSP20 family protein
MFGMDEDFGRMFDSFLQKGSDLFDSASLLSPATDISEDKDNFVFSVEIPGMNKEDFKVTVQDNTLTIRGEKKQESEVKDSNYRRVERSYGAFSRSFSLPASVKSDKIKAAYENGVLKLVLPKAEESKPKEIPISIGSQ